MFSRSHLLRFFAAGVIVCVVLLGAGCAHRYYHANYHDYHHWNSSETVYYNQWQSENHERRDYRRLSDRDKERYWEWRHREDREHDRRHGRDRDDDRDWR
jgi:hypothetical protein